MKKEKILITVKTYPTLSRKYNELVCTAGINENGEWRRIYPIRFRQLQAENKYKKYQWIEVNLTPPSDDKRPETFKISNQNSLRILGDPLSTADSWQARREAFVDQVEIHSNLQTLINLAHDNKLSLALFRPTKWLKFIPEKCESEWKPEIIERLEAERKQYRLFEADSNLAEDLRIVKKLPYVFRYEFEDEQGKRSKLMIEDWEIGALYYNCLRGAKGDKEEAVKKVKHRYWDEFTQDERRETLLILGTILEFHNKKADNPFVIVGVVPIPKKQTGLFDAAV